MTKVDFSYARSTDFVRNRPRTFMRSFDRPFVADRHATSNHHPRVKDTLFSIASNHVIRADWQRPRHVIHELGRLLLHSSTQNQTPSTKAPPNPKPDRRFPHQRRERAATPKTPRSKAKIFQRGHCPPGHLLGTKFSTSYFEEIRRRRRNHPPPEQPQAVDLAMPLHRVYALSHWATQAVTPRQSRNVCIV